MTKRASFAVAGLMMAVLFLGFGLGLGVVAQRITANFNATVALGCITFVGTTWLALWQFQKTKQKEADARVFSERAAVYQRLINITRDMLYSSRGWSEDTPVEDRAKQLSAITYEMTIWGGQDTVRALLAMVRTVDPTNTGDMFLRMSNLFKAIRKDLGHKDDAQMPDDLLLQLMKYEDHEQIREQLAVARLKR